jgi:hypothetical protein
MRNLKVSPLCQMEYFFFKKKGLEFKKNLNKLKLSCKYFIVITLNINEIYDKKSFYIRIFLEMAIKLAFDYFPAASREVKMAPLIIVL